MIDACGGGADTARMGQHALLLLVGLPPIPSLFGAMPRINPVQHLLSQNHVLHYLSPAGRHSLTGRSFFPHLISALFNGLVLVFDDPPRWR